MAKKRKAGSVLVPLGIANACRDRGGDASGRGGMLIRNQHPIAFFTWTADPLTGTITLTDASRPPVTGEAIVEWNWVVHDDGTTFSGQTFQYTPSDPGNFVVTLQVKDSLGRTASHSESVTSETTPNTPTTGQIAAAFTATADVNNPLLVTFDDASITAGAVVDTVTLSYRRLAPQAGSTFQVADIPASSQLPLVVDFGDPNTGEGPGTYEVQWTATDSTKNPTLSDSTTRIVTVVAPAVITPAISAEFTAGVADTPQGAPTLWAFDDASTTAGGAVVDTVSIGYSRDVPGSQVFTRSDVPVSQLPIVIDFFQDGEGPGTYNVSWTATDSTQVPPLSNTTNRPISIVVIIAPPPVIPTTPEVQGPNVSGGGDQILIDILNPAAIQSEGSSVTWALTGALADTNPSFESNVIDPEQIDASALLNDPDLSPAYIVSKTVSPNGTQAQDVYAAYVDDSGTLVAEKLDLPEPGPTARIGYDAIRRVWDAGFDSYAYETDVYATGSTDGQGHLLTRNLADAFNFEDEVNLQYTWITTTPGVTVTARPGRNGAAATIRATPGNVFDEGTIDISLTVTNPTTGLSDITTASIPAGGAAPIASKPIAPALFPFGGGTYRLQTVRDPLNYTGKPSTSRVTVRDSVTGVKVLDEIVWDDIDGGVHIDASKLDTTGPSYKVQVRSLTTTA